MAGSKAATVAAYLDELPAERRAVVAAVRDVVARNLPAGYEETMNWGMIAWQLPLAAYPETYNGQPLGYVALAAQKHYYSLYLTIPGEAEGDALAEAFAAAGKKMDMGRSCLRFKRVDDVPVDAIGRLVASMPPERLVAYYESSRATGR